MAAAIGIVEQFGQRASTTMPNISFQGGCVVKPRSPSKLEHSLGGSLADFCGEIDLRLNGTLLKRIIALTGFR